MKFKILSLAFVLVCFFSACSDDCDLENVVWIGSYSGPTVCFDTTTLTNVLIIQGASENNYDVIINGSDPLFGFSNSCELQLPVVTIPVSQIETARRRWEISIDGNELNYKETSTSLLSGLGISCEGVLLRQ